MTHEDIWGDVWDESEEICFNCEHMSYQTDDYCLMEFCIKKNEFTLSTYYCDDFKNRWEK
jgi:hypothetical protein